MHAVSVRIHLTHSLCISEIHLITFLSFRPPSAQRLSATSFIATNKEHVEELQRMGIQMTMQPDGRVQLTHSAAAVSSAESDRDEGDAGGGGDAKWGKYERMQSRWMDVSGDMLSLVVLVVLLWCSLMIVTAFCICCAAVCFRVLRRLSL